jgi:hypothetical protein
MAKLKDFPKILYLLYTDEDLTRTLFSSKYKYKSFIDKVLKLFEIGEITCGSQRSFKFHCSVPGCVSKTTSFVLNRIKGKGMCLSCRKKADSVVCTQKPDYFIPTV